MSETDSTEPAFRVEGDQVFKNPVTTHNSDGSRSFTMGFPVCTVSEWVDGGAQNVAGLLNQGEQASAELDRLRALNAQMREALKAALPVDDLGGYERPRAERVHLIKAAITAAEADNG